MNRTEGLLAASLLACAFSASAQTIPEFAGRQDYVGLYTQWVQIGDTNGDGIPDMVAVSNAYVNILFGNGDGTFRRGPSEGLAGEYASNFIAVDLNGDGKLDLVVPGTNSHSPYQSEFSVSLGNGDGTFQPGVVYLAGTDLRGFSNAVAGDFNGDGKLDVAMGGESAVWLFLGNGNGTFKAGVPILPIPASHYSGAVAVGDLNGDGNLDLLAAITGEGNAGGGFDVLLGNGDGTFQPPVNHPYPTQVYEIVAGPVTRSGQLGFAITSEDVPYTLVFTSDGKGGLTVPKIANVSGESVAIGDINGDGYPDIASSDAQIAFGSASGRFSQPVSYPALVQYNVTLADLRNNGLLDMVTDSQDGNSVLLSEGHGKFEEGLWEPITGGVGCSAAADFNGDGLPDLAVVNGNGLTLLFGTDSLTSPFTQSPNTVNIPEGGCPVTADLNKDGIVDLLVSTPTSVIALLGNGDGTFTQTSSTATATEGYITVADFNHDGKLDFATTGNVIALGKGDGTFRLAKPIVATLPDGGFSAIASGDINNDGWPDLVLTNPSVPYVYTYVLLNNQHGGFAQIPTNFGETGDQVILSDLNGDGIPDVAVQSGPSVGVYIGKGDGTFEPSPVYGLKSSPVEVLAARVHGRDVAAPPDLLVPDYSGGVLVLYNSLK